MYEVVILGSGPAGLTAAIYCGRAGLEPVVVEGLNAGGQLMNTTDVENYPGFPEGIQGPEMIERFKQQAARFGATFVPGDAIKVDFGSRPLRVWTAEQELQSKAVIVATGASPLELGLPGEKEYAGHGAPTSVWPVRATPSRPSTAGAKAACPRTRVASRAAPSTDTSFAG